MGLYDRLFSSQMSPLQRGGTLCSQVRETCPVGNRLLLIKFTVSMMFYSTMGPLFWLGCGVRWGGVE